MSLHSEATKEEAVKYFRNLLHSKKESQRFELYLAALSGYPSTSSWTKQLCEACLKDAELALAVYYGDEK